MIRLLFIGDIVGRPGRDLIRRGLAAIRDYHQIDLVIANVENAAAGFGITREIGDELLDRGLDVMTSGNHIWDRKEAIDYIGAEPRLLRPANFPPGTPGEGWRSFRTPDGVEVAVVNLIGRVFMDAMDCPFQAADGILAQLAGKTRVIFVDMHAEATSEKQALGWYLDGKVTPWSVHTRTCRRRRPHPPRYATDRCRRTARLDHRRGGRGCVDAFAPACLRVSKPRGNPAVS